MPNYGSSTTFLADEITQKVISVSTSAVELFTGVSRNSGRQSVRVYNDGSRTVFIGPSTVTSSGSTKGEQLQSGEAMTFSQLGDVGLYAITSGGTASLIITELA
jgi:hypothetical protein